jgi:predicted regulator of amino acid metabolism with ACT domain
MNPEQIIFENIYSMLNKLDQLKDIGMDINNISKFESDYKDILKEIDNLHSKMKISVAQIEFYQELINPLDN